MSPAFAEWEERTLALAADHVTQGLDAAELRELHRRAAAADLDAFERACAELHVAALGPVEAPPAGLMLKLQADAARELGLVAPSARARSGPWAARSTPRGVPAWTAAAGWLAAAALLCAFWLRAQPAPGLDERRAALVAGAEDLVRVPWQRGEDPLARNASGEVIWSTSRQEGYMRFAGLAPNDPGRNQYQLWIFDPTRGDWEAQPIDGGVFDVGPDGSADVPIDPKLLVRRVALFAVTLEPPGGVVVSKREHLVLTAAL